MPSNNISETKSSVGGTICSKFRSARFFFVAGLVWLAAGVNIARLGFLSIGQVDPVFIWAIVIGAIVVFTLFHMNIFSKMVGKHSNRIANYEAEKIAIWRFFDKSGYIMMAIMMTGGISLRAFGLVPAWFVAFFYTGLGIALALSGVSFLIRFIRRGNRPAPCPLNFRAFSRGQQ